MSITELVPVSDDETDQQIVEACRDGASVAAIAKQYGLSRREVEHIIDRYAPRIDGAYKRRAVALAALRLDRLTATFQKLAEGGDLEAGNLCVRVECERRALLSLTGAGYDPVQLLQSTDQQASGTPAAYREVMLRLLKPKPESE
jgi:hypothetical protein